MTTHSYFKLALAVILLAPVLFVFSDNIIEQIIGVAYAFCIWPVIKPSKPEERNS